MITLIFHRMYTRCQVKAFLCGFTVRITCVNYNSLKGITSSIVWIMWYILHWYLVIHFVFMYSVHTYAHLESWDRGMQCNLHFFISWPHVRFELINNLIYFVYWIYSYCILYAPCIFTYCIYWITNKLRQLIFTDP